MTRERVQALGSSVRLSDGMSIRSRTLCVAVPLAGMAQCERSGWLPVSLCEPVGSQRICLRDNLGAAVRALDLPPEEAAEVCNTHCICKVHFTPSWLTSAQTGAPRLCLLAPGVWSVRGDLPLGFLDYECEFIHPSQAKKRHRSPADRDTQSLPLKRRRSPADRDTQPLPLRHLLLEAWKTWVRGPQEQALHEALRPAVQSWAAATGTQNVTETEEYARARAWLEAEIAHRGRVS